MISKRRRGENVRVEARGIETSETLRVLFASVLFQGNPFADYMVTAQRHPGVFYVETACVFN